MLARGRWVIRRNAVIWGSKTEEWSLWPRLKVIRFGFQLPRRIRKERGLCGWRVRNRIEFRILMPQRLRHAHLRSTEQVNQLQGIYNALALEVIVGDDERRARILCQFANPCGPGG